jgi:hypothetical protein
MPFFFELFLNLYYKHIALKTVQRRVDDHLQGNFAFLVYLITFIQWRHFYILHFCL